MKGCRPLTEAEWKALFAALKTTRDQALFVLGIRSGFRITELLSLKLADIIEGGEIVDRVYVARQYMKGQSEGRSVVLHEDAKKYLKRWVNELNAMGFQSPGDFVFQNQYRKNKSISRQYSGRVLLKAARSLGFQGKIGTHSMRKSFANTVYEFLLNRVAKGEAIDPLLLTKQAMGHKDLESTSKYLAFREKDVADAIMDVGGSFE